MKKNVVDSLLEKKIKNIVEHTHIILMSIYKAKSDNRDSIKFCVDNYFDKFVFSSNDDLLNKYEKFYTNNKIDDLDEKRFIYIIFEELVGDKVLSSKVMSDLVYLAKALASSVYIEKNMLNINGRNKTFPKVMTEIKDKYKVLSGSKWNDVTNVKKKLKAAITKNRKHVNLINKNFFKNDFIMDFNQLYVIGHDDKLCIKTDFKYNGDEFKDFDERLIKLVYDKKGIDIDHKLIEIEKAIFYNFQWVFTLNKKEPIFIELPSKVFDKKTIINKIINITNIDGLKENIVFLIKPVILEDKMEFLTMLKDSGFKLAVDDFHYVNQNTRSIEENINYVFAEEQDLKENLKVASLEEDVSILFINKGKMDVPLLIGL